VTARFVIYPAASPPSWSGTAPTRYPAEDGGLLRFEHIDQAIATLDAIESEYDRHAALARRLTEEHFDAEKVARRVLEIALS